MSLQNFQNSLLYQTKEIKGPHVVEILDCDEIIKTLNNLFYNKDYNIYAYNEFYGWGIQPEKISKESNHNLVSIKDSNEYHRMGKLLRLTLVIFPGKPELSFAHLKYLPAAPCGLYRFTPRVKWEEYAIVGERKFSKSDYDLGFIYENAERLYLKDLAEQTGKSIKLIINRVQSGGFLFLTEGSRLADKDMYEEAKDIADGGTRCQSFLKFLYINKK